MFLQSSNKDEGYFDPSRCIKGGAANYINISHWPGTLHIVPRCEESGIWPRLRRRRADPSVSSPLPFFYDRMSARLIRHDPNFSF